MAKAREDGELSTSEEEPEDYRGIHGQLGESRAMHKVQNFWDFGKFYFSLLSIVASTHP